MFLLVPAHPSSPGQRYVKQLLLLCCVVSDVMYNCFVLIGRQLHSSPPKTPLVCLAITLTYTNRL